MDLEYCTSLVLACEHTWHSRVVIFDLFSSLSRNSIAYTHYPFCSKFRLHYVAYRFWDIQLLISVYLIVVVWIVIYLTNTYLSAKANTIPLDSVMSIAVEENMLQWCKYEHNRVQSDEALGSGKCAAWLIVYVSPRREMDANQRQKVNWHAPFQSKTKSTCVKTKII